MNRSYNFTGTQESIRGMFWFPNAADDPFHGLLHLEAGKSPRLETAQFNGKGWNNFFPGAPKVGKGQRVELTGDAFTKAMWAPAKKVIHGHDEHGKPVTLIDCHASTSRSTLAMASHQYSCSAAVFGCHFEATDLKFDGVRFHFDHLDSWVGRRAFTNYSEDYAADDGSKRLSKIIVPISRSLEIPLCLPGYSRSLFFCAWRLRHNQDELAFESRVFLDLYFDQPKEWLDIVQEIHGWQWFLSLATRTTVDVSQISLYRTDVRLPINDRPMDECPVWRRRHLTENVLHEKQTDHDFHFTFSDIEAVIPSVIGAWQRIQKPWAAVLHRFFAISGPRDLWLNEEFLFLAQAVESIYRARNGLTGGNQDFAQAAKDAYLKAPDALKTLLGNRGTFVNQLRKSRNYWTHYGDPGPDVDPDVLTDIPLHNFNEKLRWIIEAAIMQEIGIPDLCIEKVWGHQWRSHIVEYEE